MSTLQDKLRAVYTDTTLKQHEREVRIMNLCISAWQPTLPKEEKGRRWEPEASQIDPDTGMFKPQAPATEPVKPKTKRAKAM
jgi:hypothetical protein